MCIFVLYTIWNWCHFTPTTTTITTHCQVPYTPDPLPRYPRWNGWCEVCGRWLWGQCTAAKHAAGPCPRRTPAHIFRRCPTPLPSAAGREGGIGGWFSVTVFTIIYTIWKYTYCKSKHSGGGRVSKIIYTMYLKMYTVYSISFWIHTQTIKTVAGTLWQMCLPLHLLK